MDRKSVIILGGKSSDGERLSCGTKVGVGAGQPAKHGVERSDEEVVPQLHDGQPQQVPQEEPGQHAAAETCH